MKQLILYSAFRGGHSWNCKSQVFYESRRTVNKLESQLICQWGILIGPNNFLILNNGKQLKKEKTKLAYQSWTYISKIQMSRASQLSPTTINVHLW